VQFTCGPREQAAESREYLYGREVSPLSLLLSHESPTTHMSTQVDAITDQTPCCTEIAFGFGIARTMGAPLLLPQK